MKEANACRRVYDSDPELSRRSGRFPTVPEPPGLETGNSKQKP